MSKNRLKIEQTETIVKKTNIIYDDIQEINTEDFPQEVSKNKLKRIQHIAIGVGIVSVLVVACVFCVCFVFKQTTDTLEDTKKKLEAMQERANSVTQAPANVTNVNISVNKTPTTAVEETGQEKTDSQTVVYTITGENTGNVPLEISDSSFIVTGDADIDEAINEGLQGTGINPGDKVVVTYEDTEPNTGMSWTLNLKKTGLTHPEDTVFEVFKVNEDGETKVHFSLEVSGEKGKYRIDNSGTATTVSPAHSSELIITGFSAGKYRWREIQTQSGAPLLRQSFDIVFPEDKEASAHCWVNELSDELDTVVDEYGNGTAYIVVDNVREISLRTGGESRVLLPIFFAFSMMLTGIGFCLYKKHQETQQTTKKIF